MQLGEATQSIENRAVLKSASKGGANQGSFVQSQILPWIVPCTHKCQIWTLLTHTLARASHSVMETKECLVGILRAPEEGFVLMFQDASFSICGEKK